MKNLIKVQKELIENKEDLVCLDVNIGKMSCIYYYGSPERKKKLEKEIMAAGKPFVVYRIKTSQGYRELSITPSTLGLLTSFDQDVVVAVYYYLYEQYKKSGKCPKKLRIPITEFFRIMCRKKRGKFYQDIETSMRKISGFQIEQTNFVNIKQRSGVLKKEHTKNVVLFHFAEKYKEEESKEQEIKRKKHYIDLEFPDWVVQNIEAFYVTDFDRREYFELKSGRAKNLYTSLNLIRFQKTRFIDYKKLCRDLWINEKEMYHIRQAIGRSLDPLVADNFLKTYDFDDYGVWVTFLRVKKAKRKREQLTFDEQARIEGLLLQIIENLGDPHSEGFYRKIIRKVPEDIIYKGLSLTREVIETTGVKKSKGATFTDIIKRECRSLSIDLS